MCRECIEIEESTQRVGVDRCGQSRPTDRTEFARFRSVDSLSTQSNLSVTISYGIIDSNVMNFLNA